MDYLEALTRIGFTEYEAKVYLALLADHPATGYQISKTSGVPRSMVYETLSRLSARGAVLEAVEERATLYRPLPPALLIDQHEASYRRLVDDLRDGLDDLFHASAEESIWSISGEQAALSYARQMIGGAGQELYLVLPDDRLATLADGIAAACARGVTVRSVLTGEGPLPCGEVVYHPPLETELHGLDGSLIVVADGGEVLIAGSDPDGRTTITRNRNLVLIARQFIWMELFTQRIAAQLGPDLLEHLSDEDRAIFESQSITPESRA